MSFWDLNLVFLAISAGTLLTAVLLRRVRGVHAVALALSVLALWVLTAIFDNVMIASGLFGYGDHTLGGTRIGLAPLEDFAYPLGSALLLPALWLILTAPQAHFGARDRGPQTHFGARDRGPQTRFRARDRGEG